ncbi:unnamed protein product [Rhizophagus irregularis]|nr:unnamed protein product [Rhizophagus irregularis]
MFHFSSQEDELSSHYDEEISRDTPDTPGGIHGQSTVDIPNSQTEPDENTHLLHKIRPSRKQVYNWAQIQLKFSVLPVAVVLAWCAIPVPYNDPNDDSNIFSIDHIKKRLLGLYSPSNDTDSYLKDEKVEINFWFFLFFYYGIYNAIALLMITKIFDLYSLNWWPKWLGGRFAYCVFWLMSLLVGVLIYLFTGLEKYTLTWVLLTFMTMNMPLLVAFVNIVYQLLMLDSCGFAPHCSL